MKRMATLMLALLLCAGGLAQEGFVTKARHDRGYLARDPLAAKSLNPTFAFFPDSSLIDFSYLLDAPAGKHGFLTVGDDGHFEFEDGSRARFWGVVISQEHIDVPHKRIDEIVEVLARAGVNLVRLHSMDNRGGEQYGVVRRTIIDEAYPHQSDSRHFDPEYRDRVDYWIAKLKEHGIYVYLVLRAYRQFREGDGVANAEQLGRAARPYAFFNPRLIELQKEFADGLLCAHRNPYTGVPYCNDPAVVMIEIFNEDSLFFRPEMWHEMVGPYQSEFEQLWNQWLVDRYQSTDALREAWTHADGTVALQADEQLEQRSVHLPDMHLEALDAAIHESYSDPLKSPARRRDGVLFAIDVQRRYFLEMRDFLRKRGVKVPLTGVVASHIIPDTYSVAENLDFTAENAYYEHPAFEPGRAWLSPVYYRNKNYLTADDPWSLMPWLTRYKWTKRPLVCREWATCWPNQYRAASILEMAAYAGFQDFDGLAYFAYYTTGDFLRITSFGIQCDPARWGLFALGAKMFLESDVAPAARTIHIAYSLEDMATFATYMVPLSRLAWLHRMENRFVEGAYENDAHLVIPSGRSHTQRFRGTHAFLFANTPYVNNLEHAYAEGGASLQAQAGYPLKQVAIDQPTSFTFAGLGFDKGEQRRVANAKGFALADVTNMGFEPIGRDAAEELTLGFYDPRRNNAVFGSLPDELIAPIAVDLMRRWYDAPETHEMLARGLYVSDTGQLRRNTADGTLLIDTDRFQLIQGTLGSGTPYETSQLKVISQSPFAVVAATALDKEPIATSQKLLVKMVTIAENRNQKLEPSTHPKMPDYFVMVNEGTAPIFTRGEASEKPAEIFVRGKKCLEAYLVNGSWELLMDLKTSAYYLSCDTPNTRFVFTPPAAPGKKPAARYQMSRYFFEYPPAPSAILKPGALHLQYPEPPTETVERDFVYPGYTKYVLLKPAE
jgi:hypothetical protein